MPAIETVDPTLRSEPQSPRSAGADSPTRVLVVTAVDIMVWKLLLPWISELKSRRLEVHVACSPGIYADRIRAAGFHLHPLPIRRSFNVFAHLRAVVALVHLIKREHFRIVNTHSPIGGAVGRVSAWLAGVDNIIYTVHGFYFHDRMPRLPRGMYSAIEWCLGRITNGFMFVSEEDYRTAKRLGITGASARACTIYNGVNVGEYRPRDNDDPTIKELRLRHQLDGVLVIGTVGRIVKEKGYREFLEMAVRLTREGVNAKYLVIGDSLATDRDHFAPAFRKLVNDAGLNGRFVFTGMTDRVADYLGLMDIFVLASYREGFPRSVLEAMAAGLPVVTTNIRGCREAVVDGVSGYIVEAADADGLTDAVRRLVNDAQRRREMALQARLLATERYDHRQVQAKFGAFVEAFLHDR